MCGVCGCDEEAGVGGAPGQTHEGHDHAHAHDVPHRHHHGEHIHEESAEGRILRVERGVLEKNDRFAAENRGFFRGRGLYAVNLWSAPGSGKTSLIERMARDVGPLLGLSVIEGDLATDRDAARVRAAGARVVQINTGAVCHLDAHMVGHALDELAPPPNGVCVIENVGNLVCPAMFDLGEHARVTLFSVTEGEDKPIKYPHMFAKSTAVVFSKVDLLPHVPFDLDEATRHVRTVAPRAVLFSVSARSGEGLPKFYEWLREGSARVRGGSIASGGTTDGPA